MGTEQEDLETGRNLARALVERNVVVPRALLTARQQKYFDMFVPIFQSQEERFRQLQRIRAGEVRGLRVDKFGKILIDKSTTPFGEGEFERDISPGSPSRVAQVIKDVQAGGAIEGVGQVRRGGTTFLSTPEEFSSIVGGLDPRVSSVVLPKGTEFVRTTTPPEQPTGFFVSPLLGLERGRSELLIKKQRAGGEISLTDKLDLTLLGASSRFLGAGAFVTSLITTPKETITAIPSALKETAVFTTSGGLSAMIRREPEFVTGSVIGEALVLKSINRGLSLGKKGVIRASPGFTSISKPGKLRFKVGDVPLEGATLDLSADLLSTKGILRGLPTTKGTKDIALVGGTRDVLEPISRQVKLAGKQVDAVSGAESFFKLFKKKVTIDKPGDTPLETSLFFDPRGRLRTSRLGIQKQASLLEVINPTIETTLKGSKPQALLLPDSLVEKIPKGINLRSKAFKKFQLTESGLLKPVGFLSRESEVTLPAGEILKKKKGLGRTLFKGKRVELFETEIAKASPETRKLLERSSLSTKELDKLIRNIEKESGLSSSAKLSTPRISKSLISTPLSRALTSGRRVSRPRGRTRISKRPSGRVSRSPVSRGILPSLSSQLSQSRRTGRITPPSRPTPRTPKRPPGITRVIPRSRRKLKRKRKKPKRKRKFRDEFFISEGFVAKTLGLKGIKIPKTKVGKVARRVGGVGLRRKPIIVNKKKKKKKK